MGLEDLLDPRLEIRKSLSCSFHLCLFDLLVSLFLINLASVLYNVQVSNTSHLNSRKISRTVFNSPGKTLLLSFTESVRLTNLDL